jgi:hypothetical protein
MRAITLRHPAALLLAPLAALHAAEVRESDLFCDSSQPVDVRVADLLSRLTLEQKAMLLDHQGLTVQRFGIRSDQWNQCLNGVKWDGRQRCSPANRNSSASPCRMINSGFGIRMPSDSTCSTASGAFMRGPRPQTFDFRLASQGESSSNIVRTELPK